MRSICICCYLRLSYEQQTSLSQSSSFAALQDLVAPKTVAPTAIQNYEISYKKDFVHKDVSPWQCHKTKKPRLSYFSVLQDKELRSKLNPYKLITDVQQLVRKTFSSVWTSLKFLIFWRGRCTQPGRNFLQCCKSSFKFLLYLPGDCQTVLESFSLS